MTDREVLKTLVNAGRRFRMTAPVDDDFVGLKNEFDAQLTKAQAYLTDDPDAVADPNPTGRSVLQDWVTRLGLRHQGTLMTIIRGCDTAPKNDPSKMFCRMLRGAILNAFCGDPAKAQTFIEVPDAKQLTDRFNALRKNCDHYPQHYVAHLLHAIEIVGYKHPSPIIRGLFRGFYEKMCSGLHVNPETEAQLDKRLTADEDTFGKIDRDEMGGADNGAGGLWDEIDKQYPNRYDTASLRAIAPTIRALLTDGDVIPAAVTQVATGSGCPAVKASYYRFRAGDKQIEFSLSTARLAATPPEIIKAILALEIGTAMLAHGVAREARMTRTPDGTFHLVS